MRIFKSKWFQKWARKENLSDHVIHEAACEVVQGLVKTDLGGGLFKKRIARPGGGKSRGYRILIGFKKDNTDRIIFIFAFSKKDFSNITEKEKEVLSSVANSFFSSSDIQVEMMINNKDLWEVVNERTFECCT
jgi:hypothetical protein